MENNTLQIEIRGLYDGIAVVYDKVGDKFEWRDVAMTRTTEEYREMFENNLRKQFKED